MATALYPYADAQPVPDYPLLRQQALDHEAMFLETDDYVARLPANQKAALDSWLSWSPDPGKDTRKNVNRGYLQDYYSLPDEAMGNGGYETYRNRYAQEVIGVPHTGALDDESFFSLVKEQKKKQRDFRVQAESFEQAGTAFAMRLNPADPMAEAAKLKESAQMIDATDPGEADKYFEAFRSARADAEAVAAPLRPIAKAVYDNLASAEVERFSPETQAKIESAIDQLAALPEDQRGVVMKMLQQETGSDPSSTGSKSANAAIRGLTAQLRGFAENTKRGNILRVQKDLEGSFLIPEGNTPEQAYKSRLGASWADITGPLTPGTREATEEEKAQIKAMADQDLIRSDVAAQAIGVMEGTIDPIKTKGMWQKTAVNVGSSLGAMAAIAIPYGGIVLAQGGYADQEYNRQRQMGTDPGTAHNLAQVTGTVQAGLERAGFLFNFAPKSFLGKLAPKFTSQGLATSLPLQVGARMGVTQAAEYGEEIGQDLARVTSAKMGEVLGWDLPEQARMAAEWKRWDAWQPETFMAVAALSMFGGGFQGLQNTVEARAELTKQAGDAVALQAIGIAPAEAERIAALPQDQRLEAFKQSYKDRDPGTKEAGQAQAELSQRVETVADQGKSELAAMEAVGITIDRGVTEEGNAVYRVSRGDTVTEHSSAGNAFAAAREHMGQEDRETNGPLLEMLMELDANPLTPLREGSVTLKDRQTVADWMQERVAVSQDETATPQARRTAQSEMAAMTKRLAVEEAKDPDAPIDWRKVAVGGQSEMEVKEGVAKAVLRVANGESAYTPLEEKTEAESEAWVRSGETTWENLAEMIREVEQATGDKYLNGHTGGQDAAQDQMAVKEAYSELAQVHTTGKGRAGKAAASGIAEVARMDRKGARNNLRQAIATGQVRPGLVARLKAHVEWLTAVVLKARRLNRARRELGGKFALDEFLNKSVGIEAEATQAKEVVKEAERIYTPPTAEQEAAGIAFNLRSRAQPADASNVTRMPDGAELIGPTSFAIRAFHGTPHKVDRFATDRIGTGEGAQVYGHGLYFAENEAVAKEYQTGLSGFISVDGKVIHRNNRSTGTTGDSGLDDLLVANMGDIDAAIKDAQDGLEDYVPKLEALRGRVVAHTAGNLYTVDLLPEEDQFLNWDKPLSQQSESVRKALAGHDFQVPEGKTREEMTGRYIYRMLLGESADTVGVDAAAKDASMRLNAMGLPGIIYLDSGSRGVGEGTSNYVIFDDKLVRILEENGKPVESGKEASAGAGASFRLTPVETLDKLSEQMAKKTRDPEERRKVFEQMLRAFSTLRRQWTETRQAFGHEGKPLVEKRSQKELNKEQAFREAAAYQEAEEKIMTNLTPSAQAALGMTGEDVSAYGGPLAQRFTGGRFGTRGRIKSRATALYESDDGSLRVKGEYDGSGGLPPMFFGGSLAPDEAAQEAYEAGEISDPSPDALWEALGKELQTQASNREAMKSALKTLKTEQKKAREQAKAEAEAWRAEQDEMQEKDWDPRAVMLRHLYTLDAILSALPPEVRAKVGGWTAIAKLKTQAAMQKELEHRLEVADRELETVLKKDALEAMQKLLAKARPSREAGKKSKGKLGAAVHRYFDEVERVIGLTPEQVEAEQATLEAQMAALAPDPAKAGEEQINEFADLWEKQQILDTYGALSFATKEKGNKAHDAAHLTRALDQLEQVYVEGRNRWRMLEEARLGEVKEMAQTVSDTLGGPSYTGSQQQKKASAGLAAKMTKWNLDLKSFPEIMSALLGEQHPLAVRWSRAAREAYANKNDDLRALRRRWQAAMEAATGKKGVKARRILWEMGSAKNQSVKVNTAGPAKTSTQPIPIDLIEQWADGSADPAATGVTKEEAAELIDARLALEEGDTKLSLPLKRATRGTSESVEMTEAQGVFLTMLAAQEQYGKALDAAGWDADAISQVEEQLSPAAKSLREFMAKEYQEGYAPLAKVFERMFGVGLPQIKNYAPAAFYNMGGEQTMDPAGSGQIEGGFRAGFLKNRKQHMAAPKLENAFATFFGHANQTAHWKAMAETVREMTGVFNRPDVKHAIESAHGNEMLGAIQQWLKALEGNGLQPQAGQIDQVTRWFTTQQTYIALAYKLGTLLKQSSAMLGAAYNMPPKDYLKGWGKLLRGDLDVKAMWESPVIQRRLETGFAPEVRAAMNDIWTAKPSKRMALLEKGMELIGLTDAIFTTVSASIAYDFHLNEAKKAGLVGPAAEMIAIQEVADMVGATAQPSDVVDRSLMELRQGAFGKLMFMFASEARQKSSMWLKAWGNVLEGKPTGKDLRVLAISHLIMGPAMQAIGAAVRDARDDDDDEWFDAEHWDPMDFLKAGALGPLGGIPLLGDAVSGFGNDGIFSRFMTGGKAALDLAEGPPKSEDEPVEWYFKKIVQMMGAADAFTATAASAGGQAFGMLDNLVDTPEEEAGQKKRAHNRAKREVREAAKEAGD